MLMGFTSLLAWSLVQAILLAAPVRQVAVPPFATIAEEYRRAHGLDPQAGADALETLFERDYLTAAIGLFDVRYPKGLANDPKRAADLLHILGAVADVQSWWFAWRGETGEAATEMDAL